MSNRYQMPDEGAPDYSEALKYYVAADDAWKRDTGKDLKHFDAEVAQLRSHIDSAQGEACIEAGHRLYQQTTYKQ
jgi:hypothetical protein